MLDLGAEAQVIQGDRSLADVVVGVEASVVVVVNLDAESLRRVKRQQVARVPHLGCGGRVGISKHGMRKERSTPTLHCTAQ